MSSARELRRLSNLSAVAYPRFVLNDEKLQAAVLTLRRGKEDGDPRPRVPSLLLAVRAFEFMKIEIEAKFRHDWIPRGRRSILATSNAQAFRIVFINWEVVGTVRNNRTCAGLPKLVCPTRTKELKTMKLRSATSGAATA